MIMNKHKKIHFMLVCLILVCSIGITREASAATYYVAPNGSDSNNGSFSAPWATFSFAISRMYVGDTLIAKAGTYNQIITVSKSNITIQGELDASGNRLSILDTSTSITGWVSAPEIGSGVYKKTGLGYQVGAMNIIISGKAYKIARLGDEKYNSSLGGESSSTGQIAKGSTETYTDSSGQRANYWDGIEAHFASPTNSVTYIKFKNNDNPNNYTIRAIPLGNIVDISNSNVTFENFKIFASSSGIKLSGTSKSYITINNNEVINGARKIYAPYSSHSYHKFSNNTVYEQLYATYVNGSNNYGPWTCNPAYGACSSATAIRDHLYNYNKYVTNSNQSSGVDSSGIDVYGNYYTLFGNTAYNLDVGITVQGNYYDLYNNSISNVSSLCMWAEGGRNISSKIHNNTLSNCAIGLRFGDYAYGGGPLYIYNNKFWNPPNIGQHIFYFFEPTGGTQTNFGVTWMYHNSFSGGYYFQNSQSYNCNKWGGQCFKYTYYIDNIISTRKFDQDYYSGPFGLCAYNWISGLNQRPYCGSTNISNTEPMWDTTLIHDFILTQGSALNAGIDISRQFTVNGNIYSALPGFEPGYFSGSRPNIGAGEYTSLPDTTGTANCTYFAYTAWGECQPEGKQYRSVTSSSPAGCLGGTPVTEQTCTNNSGAPAHSVLTTSASPTIDGNLVEYAQANSFSFTLSTGGNTVTVKPLWNSTALYLGITVTDSQLNASAMTRDGNVWADDSIEWFIDTYNDGGGSTNPNAPYMRSDDYQGIINILNTQYDSRGTSSGTPSSSWNGVWQSAVKVNGSVNSNSDTDSGYTIEVRIPWASIGYSSAPPAESTIGLSIVVNDEDASSFAYIMWPDITASNQNASNWQKVMLSGTLATVDTTPPAPPIALMIQ